MTSFRCQCKFSRAWSLAATIGMAVVIGCAGSCAHAADDDDDELLDVKIFRGILKGLGLRRDEPTGIDYRERSPLVLPPQQGRCRRRKLTPPQRRPPAGRTIRTSSGPRRARRRSANASASRTRAWTTNRCCRARWRNAPPAPTARKAGEAPGKSAEAAGRSPAPMPNWAPRASRTMFGTVWAPKEEYAPVHRRAAAQQPDRAAARIPDAVADPALRRRPREVDRASDRQERAREITPDAGSNASSTVCVNLHGSA